MRKKMHRRLEKMLTAEGKMLESLTDLSTGVMRVCQTLQTMIRSTESYLSRFPMKVEDWATCPPLHNGEYVIWFVRKDWELESRKYTYAGGKWYGAQGEEIDIQKYHPSMWMLLPTFDPGVIEIYKRRQG